MRVVSRTKEGESYPHYLYLALIASDLLFLLSHDDSYKEDVGDKGHDCDRDTKSI